MEDRWAERSESADAPGEGRPGWPGQRMGAAEPHEADAPGEGGMAPLALRLVLAACIPVGALALIFSQSDFATGALDPAATSSLAIVPDFTPVGSIGPQAFETAAIEAPKTISLPSGRLVAPAGADPTRFVRVPFTEPSSLCAAIRLGEAPVAWDKSPAAAGLYECLSSEIVAPDEPFVAVAPDPSAFGDAQGAEGEAEAAAYDLAPEDLMVEAPPKRSLFVIARGAGKETIGSVRLKITGDTRAEAKIAAQGASAMLSRIYEALGWALPAEATRALAALDPFEMQDSGTRITLTREFGERYRYNLVLHFPDSRLAARPGEAEPSRFVKGPDDPALPTRPGQEAAPAVEASRT
ncbi:DUF6030 family protein [Aurantimonas sp. Leaf443]|uniref:DUF6030 family protein n=1 Tax=Aurantimonas sp. Leaf443 TaxID=1736378 RepID=UPI0012E35604|nr:DUF6030 family protein [Aurantimonas sp. Leaf443]